MTVRSREELIARTVDSVGLMMRKTGKSFVIAGLRSTKKKVILRIDFIKELYLIAENICSSLQFRKKCTERICFFTSITSNSYVSSLEGLFLTNANNDFTFYHAHVDVYLFVSWSASHSRDLDGCYNFRKNNLLVWNFNNTRVNISTWNSKTFIL